MSSEPTRTAQPSREECSGITDCGEQTNGRHKLTHCRRHAIEHVSVPAPSDEAIPVAQGGNAERERHQRYIERAAAARQRLDRRHRRVDEVDDENAADDAADIAFVSGDWNG